MKSKHRWTEVDHGTHTRHTLEWDEIDKAHPEAASATTEIGFEVNPQVDRSTRLSIGLAVLVCLGVAAALIGWIVRGL